MNIPPFRMATDILENILESKCRQRGTGNLIREEVVGRLNDKMARLKRSNDADDWIDVAGYGIIGWLMHQGLWRTERSVYIAHPIDHIESERRGEYDAAAMRLSLSLEPLGCNTYLPSSAWWPGTNSSLTLEINRRALLGAALLIVLWDTSEPTIGVMHEILLAQTEGIPIWGIMPPSMMDSILKRRFDNPEDLVEAMEKGGFPA